MIATQVDAWLSWGWGAERELILFAGSVFLLFGMDEALRDLMWGVRRLYRRLTVFRDRRPYSVSDLRLPANPPNFALLLAVWQEEAVVATMLEGALRAHSGKNLHIFVGCYPNDSETVQAIRQLASDQITIAYNRKPGPTTKGDNLNAAWRALSEHEQMLGARFDGCILHDAEDIVSPHEATIFAALLERFAMIQLPVVPLQCATSRWISGHYCDEFAESHLKDQIVREAIGASIPSAGVGCCVRRDLMEALALERGGQPFDPACLTEDYELGLLAHSWQFRTAFVRIFEPGRKAFVATHAPFPTTLEAAVRQKGRWITGIAMAGWDRLGWDGGFSEIWMRMRDRSVLIEASALVAGYIAVLLFVLLSLFGNRSPAEDFWNSGLLLIINVNAGLLCWRLAVRCLCTTSLYGWREGLRAIPRAVVSNVVAILAARRAVFRYVENQRSGEIVWDKTVHSLFDGYERG